MERRKFIWSRNNRLSLIMKKLKNIHPGEVLKEEFLKPYKISAYKLSKITGLPQSRLSEIIKGRRSITADTAVSLSAYFGNSAGFWLSLQIEYDLENIYEDKKDMILAIKEKSPVYKSQSKIAEPKWLTISLIN